MLDSVKNLLVLQDRDQRIMRLQKELSAHPQEEARAKQKLDSDTQRVADAKSAMQATELKVKQIEMDVETRKTTVQRLVTQQFETKKNEEYNALGHEIERYKKEIDELETQELEAMEEIDIARAKLTDAEAILAKSKTVVEDDLESIRLRETEKQAQLAEVKSEREKLAEKVSEDVLPLYEKLVRSKEDGKAVVPLRAGKCTGCNMTVIASTIIAVQQENEITQCENCGRILSMDE